MLGWISKQQEKFSKKPVTGAGVSPSLERLKQRQECSSLGFLAYSEELGQDSLESLFSRILSVNDLQSHKRDNFVFTG